MAHKVKAEGPGLYSAGLEIGQPTYFSITVNAAAPSKAKLDIHFIGPGKGDAVRDSEIIQHHDNTFTVKYTPIQQGTIGVSVTYGGDPIPKSPFTVVVTPTLDLGKIKIFGLHDKVEVGKELMFTVASKGTGGQGKVVAKITGPPSTPVPCKVEPGLISDSNTLKFILPEEGRYEVDVTYDGVPVPGSPFPVEAVPSSRPLKVNVSGAGLKSGVVGCPAAFTIDASGAGNGGLCLTVEGPGVTRFECRQKIDCTWSVSYLPMKPGDYLISILFSDNHVTGSPFHAQIVHGFDHQK